MTEKTQTEGYIDVIKATPSVDIDKQQFTDTEMLDWLDRQTTGYGKGIVFRMSCCGRGWRLYESEKHLVITCCQPQPTVRDALVAAINAKGDIND